MNETVDPREVRRAAEVERAKATLDHGIFPDDRLRSLRLHELWDRAYLALEDALATPPRGRAGSAPGCRQAPLRRLQR